MKQVRYFEARFGNTVVRHFCKNTEDCKCWCRVYRKLSEELIGFDFKVEYVAYNDGSVKGKEIPISVAKA